MADYGASNQGINLPTRTSDPTSPVEGLMWHRSDLDEVHFYLNGAVQKVASERTARIKTGTYTGDGTTSQAITGIGFQPKYVKIAKRVTTDGTANSIFETWDEMVDDNASGLVTIHGAGGGHTTGIDAIISLDSDGFTVDDQGVDRDPNQDTIVYNYVAIG